MNDSGPGEPSDPTRPPPTTPDHPGVVPPRFGDSPSEQFRPQYAGEPTAVPGQAPQTASFTPGPTGPPPEHGMPPPMEPRRDPWWQFAAPVLAGLVVVTGIAFLVVRGGGDDIETDDTDPPPTQVADTVAETDDPVVETTPPEPTTPTPTSPPLVGTAAPPPDVTTPPPTSPPPPTEPPPTAPARPTLADLEATLVTATDLGPGWTEVPVGDDDICAAAADFSGVELAVAERSFEQTTPDGAFRSISHAVTAYIDPAAAQTAFSVEVAAVEACNGTTIDIEGLSYDVLVLTDSFTEGESAAFPCRDQNTSIIASFTNPDNLVPFVGQALIAFRCGVNVVAVSIASTADLEDLNDPLFFDVAGAANIATSQLPGSG